MIRLTSLLEWGKQSAAAQQAAALKLIPRPYGQYADASGKIVAKSIDGGRTLVRIDDKPAEEPMAAGPERDAALQALKDKTKRQTANTAAMSGGDKQYAAKQAKGIAMRNAAEKRRLMGTQTDKERARAARKQYTPIPAQSDADWFRKEYPND